MTLTFKLELEVELPSGYQLEGHDIESYRRVVENALEQQDSFAGLTPDYLSDEGVGVDSFSVGCLSTP